MTFLDIEMKPEEHTRQKEKQFQRLWIGTQFGELDDYKEGQRVWPDLSEEWEEWGVLQLETQTGIDHKEHLGKKRCLQSILNVKGSKPWWISRNLRLFYLHCWKFLWIAIWRIDLGALGKKHKGECLGATTVLPAKDDSDTNRGGNSRVEQKWTDKEDIF